MAYWLTTPAMVKKPVGQYGSDIGEPRNVNIQPMDTSAQYEMFSVEVVNGRVLYDEYAAAHYYELHGRVEAEGKIFAIKAPPKAWGIVPEASHTAVLIEEVRES